MKVVHVIGARSQFIKYCPLRKALERHNSHSPQPIESVLVHTGQHYDYKLSGVFFEEFGLAEPDCNVDVGSGTHANQAGLILQRAENANSSEKPDGGLA